MTASLYRLYNQIKYYEWGSPELIPQFLDIENKEGIPFAEMWMGTHSGAPSQVQSGESLISLSQLIGAPLPFLFKLLAAEKPLSIQAHPNPAQATEGFNREEKSGIALDDSRRNYRDSNHKPEILCAISPFTVMAGFREPAEIKNALEAFLTAAPLREAFSPLLRSLETGSLSVFFRSLYELSKQQRENICAFLLENVTCVSIRQNLWKLMRDFAAEYPEDAAVLSPLYLNVFTLEPRQAVFIPAGVLHSYISGFGVELMASSDNVLRGGLTPKYVDIPELVNILDFNPFMPPVFSPDSKSFFRYPSPCKEFSLSLISGGGEKKVFPESGPAICLVSEGEIHAGSETFKKGESFFVPKTENTSLVFGGNYSLFAAGTVT